jgi:hypothetical protein
MSSGSHLTSRYVTLFYHVRPLCGVSVVSSTDLVGVVRARLWGVCEAVVTRPGNKCDECPEQNSAPINVLIHFSLLPILISRIQSQYF